MIIVFLMVLFIILLTITLMVASIKVTIEKLEISNYKKKTMQFDYKILLQLKLWKRLSIAKIVITPKIIQKISDKVKLKEKIQKVNLKRVGKEILDKEEIKKRLKKLNIELEEFHLNLELGTKDVIITSYLLALLASVLGIVLAKYIRLLS